MSDHSNLKASLEKKLEDLIKRAEDIESELSDPGHKDWSENALEMENNETLTGIENITQQEIRDIKLAIHRIESGTFGVCTNCGKSISKERLSAIPYANTCIGCA